MIDDDERRFAERLARHYRILDVDELLDRLTPERWDQLRAFDLLEPLGGIWLARAIAHLLLPHLDPDSDATVEELIESFGFRMPDEPIDESTQVAAVAAAMGAA